MHAEKIGATEAAQRFGVGRRTVYARAKRFGLQADARGRWDAAELEQACTAELKPARADAGLRAELLAEQNRRLERECVLAETKLAREQAKITPATDALGIIERERGIWLAVARGVERNVQVGVKVEREQFGWKAGDPLASCHAIEPFLERLQRGAAGALSEAAQTARRGLGL